jgi:hypothetical protein
MRRAGREACSAFRSVVSMLLRELGDFSLHPQGRPCGRPPAALRPGSDSTVTGEPASPSRRGGARAAPSRARWSAPGPRWVREASESAGPERAPTVNLGMTESQVRRLSALRPGAAEEAGAGFESHLLRLSRQRFRSVPRPLVRSVRRWTGGGIWPQAAALTHNPSYIDLWHGLLPRLVRAGHHRGHPRPGGTACHLAVRP